MYLCDNCVSETGSAPPPISVGSSWTEILCYLCDTHKKSSVYYQGDITKRAKMIKRKRKIKKILELEYTWSTNCRKIPPKKALINMKWNNFSYSL